MHMINGNRPFSHGQVHYEGSDLPIIFMLSGQGSQYYHMGENLYRNNANFRQCIQELDEQFAPLVGESVLARIYNDQMKQEDQFDDLMFTHPAIFMMEYSLCQVLLDAGIKPDCLLGASLGELSAAAVAKSISLADCVEFIVNQAKLFSTKCARAAMIAIVESPDRYWQSDILKEYSEIAGINSHSHFVVAVDVSQLDRVTHYLRQERMLFQQIPVKQGFHSSLIESVASDFQSLAAKVKFESSIYPILSAADVKIVKSWDSEYLWRVVREPIAFDQSLQLLRSIGNFHYVDVGPMGTMAALAKQNLAKKEKSVVHTILSQFSQDEKNLQQVISKLSGNPSWL